MGMDTAAAIIVNVQAFVVLSVRPVVRSCDSKSSLSSLQGTPQCACPVPWQCCHTLRSCPLSFSPLPPQLIFTQAYPVALSFKRYLFVKLPRLLWGLLVGILCFTPRLCQKARGEHQEGADGAEAKPGGGVEVRSVCVFFKFTAPAASFTGGAMR